MTRKSGAIDGKEMAFNAKKKLNPYGARPNSQRSGKCCAGSDTERKREEGGCENTMNSSWARKVGFQG